MPTCRDMSELVTDYMERAVPIRVRLEMWLHLLLCSACRHYFDQVRRTVMVLASGQASFADQTTADSVLAAAKRPGTHEG